MKTMVMSFRWIQKATDEFCTGEEGTLAMELCLEIEFLVREEVLLTTIVALVPLPIPTTVVAVLLLVAVVNLKCLFVIPGGFFRRVPLSSLICKVEGRTINSIIIVTIITGV